MILINSSKGAALLEDTKENLVVHHRNFKEIFQGNPMFSKSVIVPHNAHKFLTDLDHMSFSDALRNHKAHPDQMERKSIFGKIKNKVKRVLSGR